MADAAGPDTRRESHPETREAAPDVIRVVGLVVETMIGVFDDERGRRQRVRFDVDIEAVPGYRDRRTDDAYLSYVDVVDFVQTRAASDDHVPFVEDWAETVAAFALSHPLARRVTVGVLKLDILPGTDGVGIRITRERAP